MGKTWAADNQFSFDNLESYKNSAIKTAATDKDSLYIDEQSSDGDKKTISLSIPFA